MKKFMMILSVLTALSFVATPAFACDGVGCDDNYGIGVGTGQFGISAHSGSAIGDNATTTIPNGKADGISGGIGCARAGAKGSIKNGTVKGEVTTIGGGLTNTDTYKFHVDDTDRSKGVGSASQSEGIIGATAKIMVNPKGLHNSKGKVSTKIHGFAAEGTLNDSYVGPTTRWNSTGKTTGIAGQGAVGSFGGEAFAKSKHDYWKCGNFNNSKARAKIGANIDMVGNSYSESYRYINFGEGYKTEGMGTNVGAYTNIESSGYACYSNKGRSYAEAGVHGGWVAAGRATTRAVQGAPDGGSAMATAVGSYFGVGSLNTNYQGSSVGYTSTSVTTVQGMHGSINSSSAGMSVTSNVTNAPR